MRNETSTPSEASVSHARSWKVVINSLIVMVGFILSRFLGLIRDVVFNAYFGTSGIADVYRAAFNLPDILYLVIIGGALGSAFIPIFSQLRENEGHEQAWRLTNAVLTAALAVLAVASIVMFGLAGPLLRLLYPNFTPDQLALTVYLTRIFLLSPLLLGMGGLAMAALNATDRFTLPALAPVMYNVAIIGGIVLLAPQFADAGWYRLEAGVIRTERGAYSIEGVAWGVVIGALLYLLFQVPGLWRAGYRPRLRWAVADPLVRRIGAMMGPRVFGQAAMQINLIVMGSIASRLGEGRVAALSQAYQLMLLPHGIFAMSLATVMFPHMARLYGTGDVVGVGESMRSTLRNVLWTVIPAAVGLAVLSIPLVRVFFQRGEFDNTSTQLVADALMWYAVALPAFAAAEVLIRTFYAMHDTWTPVIAGILTILANIALGWLFVVVLHFSHASLAAAFAITNNLEAIILLVYLRRKLGQLDPQHELRHSVRRSVLGASVMAVGLGGLAWLVARRYPFLYQGDSQYVGAMADFRLLVGWLMLAMIVGAGIYITMAIIQKSAEWRPWQERIMRRLGR